MQKKYSIRPAMVRKGRLSNFRDIVTVSSRILERFSSFTKISHGGSCSSLLRFVFGIKWYKECISQNRSIWVSCILNGGNYMEDK